MFVPRIARRFWSTSSRARSRRLWIRGDWRLEVLKPHVDDSGYDLVLEANGVVRRVQLKASFRGSTVNKTQVNALLAAKPSGCVVFMWFDAKTLELGPFAFFGGAPGESLPDVSGIKVGRHTTGNAQGVKTERPNIRDVPVVRVSRSWPTSMMWR